MLCSNPLLLHCIFFKNHHTCVYDNIGFHFSNGNVCEKKHICSATDSLGDVILGKNVTHHTVTIIDSVFFAFAISLAEFPCIN